MIVEKVQHELLEEPVKVYNFQVEDFHTYYVGTDVSVLVHNDCSSGKKSRNKPKDKGKPNSVEIQRDSNGNITKYTEFDENGVFVKEVRMVGKDHYDPETKQWIPRPNTKYMDYNTNPKTGQTFPNGYKVRSATDDEIHKYK